jgi:hypothetical protein
MQIVLEWLKAIIRIGILAFLQKIGWKAALLVVAVTVGFLLVLALIGGFLLSLLF